MTSFLKLTPVKALQFALDVGLEIGITASPSQKNIGLALLPPVYTLRNENLFRLNHQAIHKKAGKKYDLEVETAIWNNAAAEVNQGGYSAKHHDPLFQHLRNIMAKSFKRNVEISFLRYMIEAYGPSRSVWQGDIRKEGWRDLEAGLEAIEQVIKYTF